MIINIFKMVPKILAILIILTGCSKYDSKSSFFLTGNSSSPIVSLYFEKGNGKKILMAQSPDALSTIKNLEKFKNNKKLFYEMIDCAIRWNDNDLNSYAIELIDSLPEKDSKKYYISLVKRECYFSTYISSVMSEKFYLYKDDLQVDIINIVVRGSNSYILQLACAKSLYLYGPEVYVKPFIKSIHEFEFEMDTEYKNLIFHLLNKKDTFEHIYKELENYKINDPAFYAKMKNEFKIKENKLLKNNNPVESK